MPVMLLNKEFYKKLPGSLSQVQLSSACTGWTKHFKTETFHLDEFFCQVRSGNSIDIYFLAFHGTFGEDGCILLELADVAYTGSSVFSAAIGMNKHQCKTLLCSWIPVLPGALIHRDEAKQVIAGARTHQPGTEHFPLFVAVQSGSSIGISV